MFLALLLSCSASPGNGFNPPSVEERLRAIGPTGKLSGQLKKAFDPGENFDPMPKPKPGDWLDVHLETGQTFKDFASSHPNRPDESRNAIYLQPLGEFPDAESPPVKRLKEYAAAFFGIEVKVLPPLDLSSSPLTTRINTYTQMKQILTGDVLTLLKRKLPDDAFCILAITMEDLYPEPSWNFVFGQASLRERVGVYSFARYDPAFYGEKRGDDYREVLLRRSCKVLAHETAHMFGLTHCIYFQCVMNGSNHLNESDARPIHLCPVCLRKLHSSVGFDVVKRYQLLLRFYEETNMNDEADWVRSRLEWISGGTALPEP
jgi:archaemetzincin